jgi:hypothetical protein
MFIVRARPPEGVEVRAPRAGAASDLRPDWPIEGVRAAAAEAYREEGARQCAPGRRGDRRSDRLFR